MLDLSPTDRFFASLLVAVVILGAIAYFSPDRLFWRPIMEVAAVLAGAAILVNLYRYWRATTGAQKGH